MKVIQFRVMHARSDDSNPSTPASVIKLFDLTPLMSLVATQPSPDSTNSCCCWFHLMTSKRHVGDDVFLMNLIPQVLGSAMPPLCGYYLSYCCCRVTSGWCSCFPCFPDIIYCYRMNFCDDTCCCFIRRPCCKYRQ